VKGIKEKQEIKGIFYNRPVVGLQQLT